jgi:polysaccharide biosynthesis/export protein
LSVVRGNCDYADDWLCGRILAIVLLRRPGIAHTAPRQHAPHRATDTPFMHRIQISVIAALSAVLLSGCAYFLPTSGPSRSAIDRSKTAPPNAGAIQLIDIDDAVTRRLLEQRKSRLFSEVLGNERIAAHTVGAGDLLDVTIWEAGPATLFPIATMTPGFNAALVTSHATTFPEQPVDDDGSIYVPFAGRIPVAGKTLQAIDADIAERLAKKANQPQVMVQMRQNFSSNATVVGEVNKSTRVPLVPGNERLLDALAAAAGVRQPVDKTTIQITRADNVYSLPMDTIIRDPQQNVPLLPGDVVTALFAPYSFTALGATGKTEEVNFESRGITLAQALARSGGLIDSRSNARGVFIFRFLPKTALTWPRELVKTTPEGMVPVVFRIDLTDPASFFLIQNFPMENRDVLYVSNAPITEINKLLAVLLSIAYPIVAIQSLP